MSSEAEFGELEQLVELRPAERHPFGGSLDLDELRLAAFDRPEHHHVHVDLGAAVLHVRKVEHGNAVDDADADRRAERMERVGGQAAALHDSLEGVVEGEEAAADARGAGAAIGLQHVAVDDDLPFAERLHVACGAQRATDQPLDLDGPAALLALRRLAVDPLRGGTGQHRVLGGHPPLAAATHPARNVFVDTGGAQHAGVAEADEDRSLGHLGEVALERDRAKVGGGAAVRA